MHFLIETTKSGFNIAITKKEGEKPFFVTKGFRIVQKKDGSGEFVSGPSRKMDSGEYFQFTYLERAFGDYILKLAKEAGVSSNTASPPPANLKADEDIPF